MKLLGKVYARRILNYYNIILVQFVVHVVKYAVALEQCIYYELYVWERSFFSIVRASY